MVRVQEGEQKGKSSTEMLDFFCAHNPTFRFSVSLRTNQLLMIKFFRRIRQQLLYQNRFRKYLIYAIGEIILVIIGILIALNINNRNAQKKHEAKVIIIFEDIMEELLADITATVEIMDYFARRDSTMRLVLNDEIKFDHYKENSPPHLYGLIDFSNSVNLTQNAYNNLVRNLDAVPARFKAVEGDLNTLYGLNKIMVEGADKAIIDDIRSHKDYLKNEYDWYYQSLNFEEGWKNWVEYYLSYRYKNEVKAYHGQASNLVRQSFNYRKKAIECYKKIAKLLDKPVNHESFSVDKELATNLVGKWHHTNSDEPFHSYKIGEDGRLYYNFLSEANYWEVIYLPKYNKLLHERGTVYATIVEENEETIVKLAWGASLKKRN